MPPADALAVTARRLSEVLDRERAFTVDASHQLRTPTAALRLDLEAAALDPSRTTVDQVVTSALDHVDRLQETIETLLTLRRDAHGTADQVALSRLIGEMADEWRPELRRQGRQLRLRLDPDLASVPVPRGAVREILRVLLDNAARHGEGTVFLTLRAVSETAAIVVADEGRLIAPADGLFRRRAPDETGHGIGLALARSLAEAEGGRLEFDARETATTFVLWLPLDVRADDHSTSSR